MNTYFLQATIILFFIKYVVLRNPYVLIRTTKKGTFLGK